MLYGKKETIKDDAKHSSVGVGSVSRVINRMSAVSKAKKEMVEQSITDLGYQPDTLARSLRTQKTHTVAFLVIEHCQRNLQRAGAKRLSTVLVNIGNERIGEKIHDA